MSVESAKAFLNKMNVDRSFANEFNRAQTGKERMSLAKNAGFEFSQGEMNEALSDVPLTEQDLESVSGGVTADTMSPDGSCPGCWWW